LKKILYFSIGTWMLICSELTHVNSCDEAWVAWTSNMSSDMTFNYKDHSVQIAQGKGLVLFKQYLSNSEIVVSDLDRLIALSDNQELLQKLRQIRNDYYTIVDMGRLGYAIILAEEENNVDLFIGAVKGIYKEKFKPLAMPLLNRAAIEYRKYQIRETKLAEEEAARARILDLYRSMFDLETGRLRYKFFPC